MWPYQIYSCLGLPRLSEYFFCNFSGYFLVLSEEKPQYSYRLYTVVGVRREDVAGTSLTEVLRLSYNNTDIAQDSAGREIPPSWGHPDVPLKTTIDDSHDNRPPPTHQTFLILTLMSTELSLEAPAVVLTGKYQVPQPPESNSILITKLKVSL